MKKAPDTASRAKGRSKQTAKKRSSKPPAEPVDARVHLHVGTQFYSFYTVVHANGAPEPAGPAQPLGTGGAGVVYRCEYGDLPHRAAKILAPRDDVLDGVSLTRFEETFEREIRTLARVTHTRIAKILDYGQCPVGEQTCPFYAMDYVDGSRFDVALAQFDPSAKHLHQLLDQILDAIVYLHSLEIMHCDLKEENVLVSPSAGALAATIVDLGVAKNLKAIGADDAGKDQGQEETTTFFSSKKLMMPDFKDRLGRPLTRGQLAEMFPSHDLYSFGRLVGIVLDGYEDRLGGYLGSSGLLALKDLHARLRDQPKSFASAAEVRQAWRKLDPGWLAPLNVDELSPGGGGDTSVPTPNGRVGLSERIRRTLNHQLVQRLRTIPQLEFLPLVLPGATHTRLLHSLTTFDMARLYIAHLLSDPSFRLMAESHDIEAALLWALLHDVGHYPLSHMFEDFAHEEQRRDGSAERTIPTDDDLFWSFVDPGQVANGNFSHYPEIIEEVAKERGTKLGDGLLAFASEEGRFEPEVSQAMRDIATRAQPVHSVLAGVLSSPIDVDKVAYLQDDSLMSGVRFGAGIDLAGLLNALRAPHADQIKQGEPVLAITDHGQAAAEKIVLARYWMLQRVYWNHENRAMMAMGKFVIAELLQCGALSMEEYYRENVISTQEHALRWLSDKYDQAAGDQRMPTSVDGGPERQARNPLPGLRDGRREIYRRIITISNHHDDNEQQLYERLAFKAPEVMAAMMERMHKVLDAALGRTVLRGDILLDVPFRERERLDVDVWVYSGRRPTEPAQLRDFLVVESLRSEFDKHVKKCRVFIHPEIAVEIGDRLHSVREELLVTLRTSCGL